MVFWESFKSAWLILVRNKMRSFLTMLGIIIGVLAVIFVMSVGAGAQSLILNQITSMGTNLVGVLPGKSDEKGPPATVFGIVVTTLTDEDGEAIMKSIPAITAYTSYVKGIDTVAWEERTADTTFVGVNAGFLEVEDTNVARGRFFTEDENRGAERVAVMGSQTARDLFGDEDPIGKTIKIKRVNFEIIGVMRERGVSGFQNQDNQILVPLRVAQKMLLGIDYVSMMHMKVDTADHVDGTLESMAAILRERHDIDDPENDDFSVRSMAQGIETMSTITNALKIFLTAVAAISLLVGGIGIMNIMLAAVEERTKEIGLRKAVGANNTAIMRHFLVETCCITFIAGMIGIMLGAFFSWIVTVGARGMGYDWEFVLSPSSVILASGVSITIGLVFGLIPARRASRLDPISALRYE